MDKLVPRELKPGHHVKVEFQGNPYQEVESVEQVDPGIHVPIYKIKFLKSTFELYCNGDREFEVLSTTPQPTSYRTGLEV